MKDKILKAIEKNGGKGVSFVNLERDVEGFSQDNGLAWGNENNLVYWVNMSDDAVSAMVDLIKNDLIVAVPTETLVYMIDGKLPKLPVAKSLKRKYKEQHWLPMVFSSGKG